MFTSLSQYSPRGNWSVSHYLSVIAPKLKGNFVSFPSLLESATSGTFSEVWSEFKHAQLLHLKVHSLPTGPCSIFPLSGGRKGSEWFSSLWSQFLSPFRRHFCVSASKTATRMLGILVVVCTGWSSQLCMVY